MCTEPEPVISASALTRAGLTRRDIARALDRGEVERLRRGVYARPGACIDARSAASHGGRMACVTAARHLGLWVLADPGTPHVWLRGHGHTLVHDACRCVEHWDDGAASDSFGLPSVPRVLRQILTCCGVEAFFVALESAIRLRRISRPGIAWLRTACTIEAGEAIDFARGEADSGLESLVRWRLRHLGLRIRAQVTIVSVGRVDLLIGDRLIIEVDGRAGHDDPASRHKDRMRDAHAAMWGYITLRFDYALVVHDWDVVERAILAHVVAGRHLADR